MAELKKAPAEAILASRLFTAFVGAFSVVIIAWCVYAATYTPERQRCDKAVSYRFTAQSGRGVVQFDQKCIVTSNDVFQVMAEIEDPAVGHARIASWRVNQDSNGVPVALWFELDPSTINYAPMP